MPKDLQIINQLRGRFEKVDYKIHNNEVIKLELNFQGVNTIDLKLIGELTSLRVLDLSYNNISKIEGLEKLTNLETLWLYKNLIPNKIDKIEIDQLKIKNSKINVYV